MFPTSGPLESFIVSETRVFVLVEVYEAEEAYGR
jgi:hypothetical protein